MGRVPGGKLGDFPNGAFNGDYVKNRVNAANQYLRKVRGLHYDVIQIVDAALIPK